MVFRDWANPQDYVFARELNAAQWAWEFLRRNHDYQVEWQVFGGVWQALEADYGRPPDRDFGAWRLDSRAWVNVADCPEGECRVDQDKVLIECALGARWGFYKFPPDPADDDPVGQGRLAWREVEQHAELLGAQDTAWLGGDPARVAIGFDLTLPLRAQMERAKRLLQVMQRQRVRSGEVQPRSIETLAESLTLMLRLLDAESAGDGEQAYLQIDAHWPAWLDEAHAVRDGGYRRLLSIPDERDRR